MQDPAITSAVNRPTHPSFNYVAINVANMRSLISLFTFFTLVYLSADSPVYASSHEVVVGQVQPVQVTTAKVFLDTAPRL